MKVVYISVKVADPPDDLDRQLRRWGMHICARTDAFMGVCYEGVILLPGKPDVAPHDVQEAHRQLEKYLDIPVEMLGMYITGRPWDVRCGKDPDLHPKLGRFVTEEYPL